MNELLFSVEADKQLSTLQTDSARSQLFDRINDVLDAIEDNPANPAMRCRRYQTPPIWGVAVHGSGEDWLVLWNEVDTGPFIHYIGVDLH